MKTTKKELARLATLRGDKTFPAPCKKCGSATEHYVSDKKCIPCMMQRKGIRTPQERAKEKAQREAQRQAQRAAQRETKKETQRQREALQRAEMQQAATVRQALREEQESNRRAVVYSIRCAGSGREYIGSTVDPKTRLRNHLSALRRGDHHVALMARDFAVHGEESFSFRELCSVAVGTPTSFLTGLEKHYIQNWSGKLYNTDYNRGENPQYQHKAEL